MAARGQFSSRLGFLMAAAGSAVGLGNIWGFPTQTASNGGAAFVLVYLALAFLLAYPALMAELTIGRAKRANVVDALGSVSTGKTAHYVGATVGLAGVLTASLILSFYAILAGWMMSHMIEPIATLAGATETGTWLTTQGPGRDIIFTILFSILTMLIIVGGVRDGIEKWSTRLMPSLITILIALIIYVLMQPGAMDGLKLYLVPDFSGITNPDLLLSAMGQAFFSLSLGVGTMLIYGSYVSEKENLPRLGASLTLIDTGIAFTAGLLIIPAMFVAQEYGTTIYSEAGELAAGPGLIFAVLPSVFDGMGATGSFVAIAFFLLMSIAALTSSISMLEVPVSFVSEHFNIERKIATFATGTAILAFSILIALNFDTMFGFVADLATVYLEPLIGLAFCIFAGWLWNRNEAMKAIAAGHPDGESAWFVKVWPWYVKVVCPALIITMLFPTVQKLFS
ncbi:sodium-dependent transporter [Umboniibacter marinipuniceus]|uniref:NSS family neurotransmitter:Na+ symporter n=1 Tax=Umboniibacter marinipuniceus TaxID=569599 RepID=A0A3M0AC25_9GAMM|nr:sodium-dependent transporter [Umboniibacter marinipuniceus]RMA82723.1 NSS family neurotransmitter:Na+ symporter [Umboniibacter marinipuniceus]